MANKIGNGSIPLRIGRLIDTTVYGGPYKQVPEFFWGVKMAEEINHPHMVAVDTRDFSVPKESDLKKGIVRALMAMINEEDVYAGCMGGIGRTGIFLAALAKVQIEYRKSKHRAGRGDDPVLYVRKHFIPHAVETKQQEEFIANLDVSDIVEWLNVTQTAMGLGGLTPGKSPTGRVVDDRIPLQNLKPNWIPEEDKIENPAFDRYGQGWKMARDNNIAELVERDLDWMDEVDADSADEQQTEEPWVAAINDLNMRLDELEGRVDVVDERGGRLEEATRKALRAVDENFNALKDLTNQTLSSKVWGMFRK
jgi:hypothetical protein